MEPKNVSETQSNDTRITKIRPASAEIWRPAEIEKNHMVKQRAFRFAATAVARSWKMQLNIIN